MLLSSLTIANLLLGTGQHNHSVKAMQAEIAAALRRTGTYLSHLGRLKLGVTTAELVQRRHSAASRYR